MSEVTLNALTARLRELLDSRPAAEDALFRAMCSLTIEHADHLRELGPIRVLALDPCPRCTGRVIASETVAKCAAGCGFTRSAQ